MPYDYEQYLSDKLQSLYFDSEQYSSLRKLIESDKELVFAVRKNEIHIYYLGGRILKIKGSKKLRSRRSYSAVQKQFVIKPKSNNFMFSI